MKSKIIGRRQLLIGVLSLSLCAAVFVNWYYTKPQGITEQNKPELTTKSTLGEAQYVNGNNTVESSDEISDYFGTAKLNRTKAHDNAKEHLNSLISDSSTGDEEKKLAQEKLVKLSDIIKTEADTENLISAQSGTSCLVTIGDDSVEVILPKATINDNLIIKIKDIIISKTKMSSDAITIIELK